MVVWILLLLLFLQFGLIRTLTPPNPRIAARATTTTRSSNSRRRQPLCSGPSEIDSTNTNTRIPQTLMFRDASTGVPIHLIGTMHYNPHSIRTTESIVQTYGEEDRLGSVILESCPKRWEAIQERHPQGSLLRRILDNEFQTASETASLYDHPRDGIVLADEDIDANDQRVNDVFLSSLSDYLNPLGGGWTSLSRDLLRGYGESIDPTFLRTNDGSAEEEYLEFSDLWDPGLAAGTPLSLGRYTVAALVRKPVKGALLLAWIALLVTLLVTRVGFADGGATIGLASVCGFVLSLSVGLPLLGRVFLFALLGERNTILANNIREECRRVAQTAKGGTPERHHDKVCVVVLGLAHCNGVKRELCCSESIHDS